METAIRNVVTLSISFFGDYNVSFNYLANPLNQKEWAVHFILDIEEVDGQVLATLPFGKTPLSIAANQESGTLDIQLGDGKPTRTRLIEIEKGFCVYNFTLAQPKDMPDIIWQNEGLPNLEEELNTLKTILESR